GQDGEAGAIAAARAARESVGTDIGIAVIGPADPDAHPPGTVFAGVALPDGDHGKTVALPGVLSRMRSYAVITLLDLLRKRLA
ncbi:MAG: CinA family protein, partial [Rhodospirillaceae bacterium]